MRSSRRLRSPGARAFVTAGGILGKVTETSDNFLTVEIANGVQVKVQRHTVTSVLPKGTLKSA